MLWISVFGLKNAYLLQNCIVLKHITSIMKLQKAIRFVILLPTSQEALLLPSWRLK